MHTDTRRYGIDTVPIRLYDGQADLAAFGHVHLLVRSQSLDLHERCGREHARVEWGWQGPP